MSYKKWILTYIIFMLITGAIMGLFNVIIDPFGVFGDSFLNWYAYDMTNNPRVAKIAYLKTNQNYYDSYIIGCSKTSSFSTETLNKYFVGSKFYNMIMYGGDMYDVEKTACYLLDNYKVKNLVVNIGLEESTNYNYTDDNMKNNLHALVDGSSLPKFYGKYFFANPEYSFIKLREYFNRSYLPGLYSIFLPESGVYNKIKRDGEAIGALEVYLKKNSKFHEALWKLDMHNMDKAVESIRRTKVYCEKKGVRFTLIASPVYYKEVQMFKKDMLIKYWEKIAKVTDFWDFSGYSSISYDPRYFYDSLHFRNSIGDMALAYMFNDKSVYRPKDFGHYTTMENVSEHSAKIFNVPSVKSSQEAYTVKVPILSYHNLDKNVTKENTFTVTPEKFRSDMEALKEKGFNTILFRDVLDYVNKGKDLPQNPILITFDDGYTSNYQYAYPILKELGMKATISVIGISAGKDTYKGTNIKMFPHFDYAKAKEMYDSGIIDIQSHSFNMHDNSKYEGSYREGVLQKANEREKEYISILKKDYAMSKETIEKNVGNKVFVYTYPMGKYSVLSEALLREFGNKITVTTQPGVNMIVKGLPQSLYALKRINVTNDVSSDELLKEIDKYMQKMNFLDKNVVKLIY